MPKTVFRWSHLGVCSPIPKGEDQDNAYRNFLRCSTISGSSIHKIMNRNTTAYYRKLVETKICLNSKVPKTEPNTDNVLNFAKGNAVEEWIMNLDMNEFLKSREWGRARFNNYLPQGIYNENSHLSAHPDFIIDYYNNILNTIIEVKASKVKTDNLKTIAHVGDKALIVIKTVEQVEQFLTEQNQTLIKGLYQVMFYHYCYNHEYGQRIFADRSQSTHFGNPELWVTENIGKYIYIFQIQYEALVHLLAEVEIAIRQFNVDLKALNVVKLTPEMVHFKRLATYKKQIKEFEAKPEFGFYKLNKKHFQASKESLPQDIVIYDPETKGVYYRKELRFKTPGSVTTKTLKNILYFNYE